MRRVRVLEQKEELLTLLDQLDQAASLFADGHYTLMAFTTNWRCMLRTPADRWDIEAAPKGRTANEAIKNCLLDCDFAHVSRLPREQQRLAVVAWRDRARWRSRRAEYDFWVECGAEGEYLRSVVGDSTFNRFSNESDC